MTTPNINKHSFAQHAVSTPLASNPGTTPRSVPSPAIPRSASKVSTTAQSQNAGLARAPQGGAPMTASLSQMSNVSSGSQQGLNVMASNLLGASPSNNLLAFASPAALAGLDMATPALLDAAAAGGQAMNLSLSDLGIHSGKRNEDEERRAKLETVLRKLLGQKRPRFGRVSEEGIRRVGRWAGFDVEVEAKWEPKQFEGQRPVAVAGKNNVLIDFSFKNNLPTKIDVSFFSEEQTVSAHQAAAASVLLADLTPPPGVAAINTRLDRFAANLETLARLDKLSVSGQLNCFEAITGVYESLRKLYEHEKEAAKTMVGANKGNTDLRAERHVLCKKSGRPQMHARRKIGLSLDYWMEKSHVYPKPKDENAMDVDTSNQPRQDPDDPTVYSIEITAESSSSNIYPSLRVSSSWLSSRILKPTEETTDPTDLLTGTQSIDWLDPPPTLLQSQDSNPDAMTIDNASQKHPEARFVARLHPPIAMPWTTANHILQTVGAATGDMDPYRTYEASLLQKAKPTTSGAAAATTSSVCGKDGVTRRQRNSLFVPKQDFGYVLDEFPFAHPKQVVEVLPLLRTWAVLGSLLRGIFLPSDAVAPVVAQEATQASPSLEDLLAKDEETVVDVSLTTSPSPMLDFVVGFGVAGVACVGLGVLAGGQIVVTSQDLIGDGQDNMQTDGQGNGQNGDAQDTDAIAKIAKALEVTGDIGVWVEWLRNVHVKERS